MPVRAAVAEAPMQADASFRADAEKEQMRAEIEEMHKTIHDMQMQMNEILQKLSDAQ